jgi:hypothetical protein
MHVDRISTHVISSIVHIGHQVSAAFLPLSSRAQVAQRNRALIPGPLGPVVATATLPMQYTNDSKPWPIQIEDHEGTLHSVNLEPGQMLFYESAKCLHGRMQVLDGKYYGRYAHTHTTGALLLHPAHNTSPPPLIASIASSIGGSIFLHYQPVEKAQWGYTHDDVIAAVPPHWRRGVREEQGSRWAGAGPEPF